jgi:polyhydroxyalkanoate synthesis regulator phasin
MSEFSDRIKEQLEQFNDSIDQIINASRGLYIKIKEESNKQFDELVKAGEAQKTADASLLDQLRKDITSPFEDMKGSLNQLRSASLGLVVKTREAGEQYFNELVELGAKKEEVTE